MSARTSEPDGILRRIRCNLVVYEELASKDYGSLISNMENRCLQIKISKNLMVRNTQGQIMEVLWQTWKIDASKEKFISSYSSSCLSIYLSVFWIIWLSFWISSLHLF
ncbi:unnamed protein product [Citrullus colocynthis]|uniref:Uncharacterized protein n=1 Tax=Citrullus colocynthis TaxID=252529 RepID=A0ABP0YKP7_9ROSI